MLNAIQALAALKVSCNEYQNSNDTCDPKLSNTLLTVMPSIKGAMSCPFGYFAVPLQREEILQPAERIAKSQYDFVHCRVEIGLEESFALVNQ